MDNLKFLFEYQEPKVIILPPVKEDDIPIDIWEDMNG